MEVNCKTIDGIVIVELPANLDEAVAGAMQEKLIEQLAENNNFILDMDKCKFIVSSSLRVILALGKKVHTQKGKLVIANAKDAVKDIMHMTGFDKVFSLYNTLDDALSSFK